MFLIGDTVVRSPTDLKAAVECEWALMRRLDARLGRAEAVPDPDEWMRDRAAALGDAHERRELDRLLERYGTWSPGAAGGVAVMDRPDGREPTALAAAQAATIAALAGGADVVFQATFFDGSFLGYADFLRRSGAGWRVVDTKLARRARVDALLQIAAYAAQLERLGFPVAPQAELLLGDGTTSAHRLADVAPAYALRMRRLDELVADRLADDAAIAWGVPGVHACGRCAECTAQVEATRDVQLVGRLRTEQRVHLLDAGVRTIDDLAAGSGPVPGIAPHVLTRLRRQAALQLAAPPEEPDGRHPVAYEVHDPAGLAALPRPDAGDVFFDFEGDPLWTDDDRTWGLEYLFGVVDHDGGREHYRPFWAHDRPGERQALLDFLGYLTERRRVHPGLHVYHYADYERSHLQQLCARHGVGEAQLDALLVDNVFVDLYPVVTRSIRISDRSYSLKKLEPLYMGDELRQSAVATGAESVQAYVDYRELRDAGDAAAAEAQLAEIRDYNRYDCVSTLRLRDWLLARAAEHGVRHRLDPEPPERGDPALERRETLARDRLLGAVEGVAKADRTPQQAALAMAAAAIEYHRREAKSFWWAHYDRQVAPVDDWADQKGVFVVDGVRVLTEWSRGGRQQSDARTLLLRGRIAPGSVLESGDDVYVMYADPVPVGCDPVPRGQRGEHPRGKVRAVRQHADGRAEVELGEVAGKDRDGSPFDGWRDTPIALTPRAPIPNRRQRGAILEWGERLADELPQPGPDAVLDLLLRRPPRLRSGVALPAGGDPVDDLVRAALDLDRSYLAVQGPPGTGKTHVGAHVVARLVRDHGWRVGVVGQSHPVVDNLLQRLVDLGVPPERVGKRPDGKRRGTHPGRALGGGDEILRFLADSGPGGLVLGGTSWDFADPGRVPRRELDLLVVDEAGQYSLADTIAVGVSARNLLLLGDPQQLPQVSQGLHPEPVDTSALGWLTEGHDVLPTELGYFLERTWRMHPALTAAVSDLAYEGRLVAREPETTERRLDGVDPGLHPEPVVHSGCTTESPDEADRVVELVRQVVGLPWTDPSCGREHEALTARDVIVVAPYNAQVALIRDRLDAAGFDGTEVGTVDRFQGREAVVAIVSLTASSALDVPRGIGFVLLRNRLNVAVSRAKWAAYLVHSPALADYLPRTAEGLAELCGFLRLTRGTAPVLQPA